MQDLYGQVFMYEVMMVNHMNSESDITSQGEDFTFFVIANHYPQLSEINSLRLAYGEPPPSKREAISGSLFEGAVSEAD